MDRPDPEFFNEWLAGFYPKSLDVFRGLYPRGRNLVLSPAVKSSYSRRVGAHTVTFLGSISDRGEGVVMRT